MIVELHMVLKNPYTSIIVVIPQRIMPVQPYIPRYALSDGTGIYTGLTI